MGYKDTFTSPHVSREDEPPAIGITYLQSKYGLKNFFKKCKKSTACVDVFEEFIDNFRNLKDIDTALAKYSGAVSKSKDADSQKILDVIRKKHNIDTSDMIHVHCKPGGKGAFVLHGFRIRNRFEIVWIDPDHAVHKVD